MNVPCPVCEEGRIMVFEGFVPIGKRKRSGEQYGRLRWVCEGPEHPRKRVVLVVPALAAWELVNEPRARTDLLLDDEEDA